MAEDIAKLRAGETYLPFPHAVTHADTLVLDLAVAQTDLDNTKTHLKDVRTGMFFNHTPPLSSSPLTSTPQNLPMSTMPQFL